MPVDMNTVPRNHLGALISFVVALILSFIGSYVTASYDDELGLGDFDFGVSAWESYATFGMLLLIVAAAIVAARAFPPQVLPAGVPWQLIALAAAALGTLLLILRALTWPGEGAGFSVGPGWSAYALWVAAIAQTVFTALGFRESGEQAPWQQRTAGGAGTTGGTAGTTGTTGTMPPAAGPTSSAPPPPTTPPPPSTPPGGPTSGPPPPA